MSKQDLCARNGGQYRRKRGFQASFSFGETRDFKTLREFPSGVRRGHGNAADWGGDYVPAFGAPSPERDPKSGYRFSDKITLKVLAATGRRRKYRKLGKGV